MVVHHIARRGVEAFGNYATSTTRVNEETPRVPAFAALIFFLTFVVFFVLIFCISYTYGHVIPTLCMIESPETNAYVPVNNISAEQPPAYTEDGEDDGVPKPVNADEVLLVRNQPFTSSLRQTVRHLRARGGFWAPLRGLGLFVVWGFMRNLLVGLMSFASNNVFVVALSSIVAEIVLAHIHMTWVHIVISEPSMVRWYRRIPSPAFKTWRKIAPATAVWAITTQFVYILPMLVMSAGSGRFHNPEHHPGQKEIYMTMGQMFGAMLLMMSLFILLEIPAMVTLVRVAASMLPEEDETVVPFDRTYGGKVSPAIIGGDGKIDLVEAWRSFPWASRKRLVLLCAKVAGLIAAVWVCFTLVFVLEAHLLFGTQAFGEMMKGIHGVAGGR